jgi:hypothetical protein
MRAPRSRGWRGRQALGRLGGRSWSTFRGRRPRGSSWRSVAYLIDRSRVFDGGGPGEATSGVQPYQTPIVANGRIFVAGDREVYAFTTR